ncbi:MAG: NUMOD3 domain-containing DNA-binding protein [Methanoregula sp.]|jgi:hypothetical protein
MPLKGTTLSAESKRKLRESHLGQTPWNKGKHPSEESRQKMREAKLGKVMSDDFKQNKSEFMKSRWEDPTYRKKMIETNSGENHCFFGKHFSEEHRKKISDSAKQRTDNHIEKLRQINSGRVASESEKKKRSEMMKLLWSSKEYRDKLVKIRSIQFTNKKHRENIGIASAKAWKLRKLEELDQAWYGCVKYYHGPQYCEKWTTELRERVRSFFGYCCVECGAPQNGKKLHIHHVWYNKRLCCDDTPRSLVPLCVSCHSKTNTNRDYWSKHFQEMIDTYYNGKCWFTKEEMQALLK